MGFRTIIGFAKLPPFLSLVFFLSTLNQRTSFPCTMPEERTNSHIYSKRSDVTGPKHGLNSPQRRLKATAILYVLRCRRNKDYSELFSGPGKTKTIIQTRRLESRASASIKQYNLNKRLSVEEAATVRIYSKQWQYRERPTKSFQSYM